MGVSVDDLEYQEDVGILLQYSVISRTEDPVSFSMHRLVHLPFRAWLLGLGTLGKWQAEALRRVADSVAEQLSVKRETKYLTACDILEPYVDVVLKHGFETGRWLSEGARAKSKRCPLHRPCTFSA